MRIKTLKIGNEVIKGSKAEEYLHGSSFDWLLNCEFDDAVLEIINDTLIWKSGILYWGIFEWGIFEGGEFRSGTYNGGIIKSSAKINDKINTEKLLKIK